MYSARWGSPDYDGLLKSALESIAHQLERDLERNERENNYITDDTAKELKLAVGELERCGISTGSASGKIEKLAWFVGGDPAKIRELQRKLNQLGIGEHLNEDGVYGGKTLATWETYIKTLATGSLPVAGVINPLQSDLTGISHKVISGRKPTGSIANYYHINGIPSPNRYSVIVQKTNDGMKPIFRLDHPHYENGIPLPYHMNVDMDVPKFAKNYFYNHKEISESTYLRLKDFKNASKYVRVAGKALLATGIALDALELGMTIDADLKDADRKLGKRTLSTAASIGGSWAGAALGAKGGAMLGAVAGTAAFPFLGTAIGGVIGGVFGGIGGGLAGDKLATYIVDITYLED